MSSRLLTSRVVSLVQKRLRELLCEGLQRTDVLERHALALAARHLGPCFWSNAMEQPQELSAPRFRRECGLLKHVCLVREHVY
mmetsp:Transcript_82670/g.134062  ORF Transcript_82670/g.134062 Transcript_82670/m.134062 type:complete len:83 (-) Transcript_82670:341-589(-)